MSGSTVADPNAKYLPHVPKAVRDQVRAAEAQHAQVYAGQAPAADTTVVVEPPGGQAPPAASAGVPPQVSAPTNPAPTNPAAPAQAPADDGWEQRFRSLEGRFNAQTQELREERGARQRFEGQIAELTMRANQAQQATQPVPGQEPDPNDVETWGADMLGAARRQARAELMPEIQRLTQRLAQVESTATTAGQRVNQATLESQLAALVGPDWNSTNHDQKFIDWLNQIDEFSGQPRMNLMRAARDTGDAARVARFFNAYRSQHTAGQPATANPGHTPAGAAPVNLADLAAPGAPARAPGNGATPGPVVVTTKDMQQFYSDVAKGKYKGRETARQQRESEIFAASAEGRVQ